MSRDIRLTLSDVDPTNARKYFDGVALTELAQSIQANGLAVPIMVRPIAERFMIVQGERRYRAVALLGWPTISAKVRELTAEAARWLSLAKHVQRADLSSLEEAQAYQAMLTTGLTQAALGARLGKSQSYITQKLCLLTLPQQLQTALLTHKISESHAHQLLRLKTANHQTILSDRVLDEPIPIVELSKMVDEVLKLETFNASLQSDFRAFNLNFDKLYFYFTNLPIHRLYLYCTPAQFRQLMREQFTDEDILDVLEFMYANRYHQLKSKA